MSLRVLVYFGAFGSWAQSSQACRSDRDRAFELSKNGTVHQKSFTYPLVTVDERSENATSPFYIQKSAVSPLRTSFCFAIAHSLYQTRIKAHLLGQTYSPQEHEDYTTKQAICDTFLQAVEEENFKNGAFRGQITKDTSFEDASNIFLTSNAVPDFEKEKYFHPMRSLMAAMDEKEQRNSTIQKNCSIFIRCPSCAQSSV